MSNVPSDVKEQSGLSIPPRKSRKANIGAVATAITKADTPKPPPDDGDNPSKQLDALAALLTSSDPWKIADIVVELRDDCKLKFSVIVNEVESRGAKDYKIPYFSQGYRTAKTFPKDKRFSNLSYTSHFNACKAISTINNSLKRRQKPQLDAYTELAQLVKLGLASGSSRSIINALRRKLIDAPVPAPSTDLIDGVHHADCIPFAAKFEAKTVPLVWLDPPFGQYVRTRDGRLDESTSAFFTDHDNGTETEAIKITCDAIRAWEPSLLVGGMMMVWQADKMMRPQIAQAIIDTGLLCVAVLVWHKPGRSKVGNYDCPFAQTKEFCYVLMRKDEKYRVVSTDPPLDDILNVDMIRADADGLPHHLFEKPVKLCADILRAVTQAGELVVEAFGCTGSMSKAAIELGRKWVYVESNGENFTHFAGLVQQEHEQAQKLLKESPPAKD